MGASMFDAFGRGMNAQEAFVDAVKQACYDFGTSGYTGSIAEKTSFVLIPVPDGVAPGDHANDLLDSGDPKVDDKWGPAGCVILKEPDGGAPGEYMFFGWASS